MDVYSGSGQPTIRHIRGKGRCSSNTIPIPNSMDHITQGLKGNCYESYWIGLISKVNYVYDIVDF